MKTVINETQKGLLFKNGKFIKLLGAGKYYTFGESFIEICSAEKPIHSDFCSLDVLLANDVVRTQCSVADIGDRQIALHFVDGKFEGLLTRGKYAFWSMYKNHEFQYVDISSPEVSDEVPEYIFSKIPPLHHFKIEVAQYEKARLFYNRKFVKLLDAGTYYFWRTDINVEVEPVDTRLTRFDIVGQEMLTLDKVAVRINFVCNYRITDYVRIMTEIDDYKEQIHICAQLALRDYVGKHKFDEILDNKDEMSEYVFDRLKSRQSELYVEFTDAGVKDIILPGEIRDIMNTVLIAEKRAQANVITRREEVASTRSLLNTAKLMDENSTLCKLKELEYVERICENVGNINLNSGNDILTQLACLLRKDAS